MIMIFKRGVWYFQIFMASYRYSKINFYLNRKKTVAQKGAFVLNIRRFEVYNLNIEQV